MDALVGRAATRRRILVTLTVAGLALACGLHIRRQAPPAAIAIGQGGESGR